MGPSISDTERILPMARIKIYIENDEVVIKGDREGLAAFGREFDGICRDSNMTHTHIISPVFPLVKDSLKCVIELESCDEVNKTKRCWCIILLIVMSILLVGLIFF